MMKQVKGKKKTKKNNTKSSKNGKGGIKSGGSGGSGKKGFFDSSAAKLHIQLPDVQFRSLSKKEKVKGFPLGKEIFYYEKQEKKKKFICDYIPNEEEEILSSEARQRKKKEEEKKKGKNGKKGTLPAPPPREVLRKILLLPTAAQRRELDALLDCGIIAYNYVVNHLNFEGEQWKKQREEVKEKEKKKQQKEKREKKRGKIEPGRGLASVSAETGFFYRNFAEDCKETSLWYNGAVAMHAIRECILSFKKELKMRKEKKVSGFFSLKERERVETRTAHFVLSGGIQSRGEGNNCGWKVEKRDGRVFVSFYPLSGVVLPIKVCRDKEAERLPATLSRQALVVKHNKTGKYFLCVFLPCLSGASSLSRSLSGSSSTSTTAAARAYAPLHNRGDVGSGDPGVRTFMALWVPKGQQVIEYGKPAAIEVVNRQIDDLRSRLASGKVCVFLLFIIC